MNYLSLLPQGVSLIAFLDDKEIFRSSGKWLHPLFELAKLEKGEGELTIHDTVIGIAAAFLAASIGVKKVHANLASEGAIAVAKRFGVSLVCDKRVEKILCKTESLLSPDMSEQEALKILRGLLKG